MCRVSLDVENDRKIFPEAEHWKFLCPEVMFNPNIEDAPVKTVKHDKEEEEGESLFDFPDDTEDSPTEKPTLGIVEFTYEFIEYSLESIESQDDKDELWRSVLLCGGNTAFPNFFKRFDQEMRKKYPNFPGVVQYPDMDPKMDDTYVDSNDADSIARKTSYQQNFQANTKKAIFCENLIVKGASYFASIVGFKEMCEIVPEQPPKKPGIGKPTTKPAATESAQPAKSELKDKCYTS